MGRLLRLIVNRKVYVYNGIFELIPLRGVLRNRSSRGVPMLKNRCIMAEELIRTQKY